MDEIRTGVFEISTAWNDFWKDWQVELAKEDLKRRAKAAMDKIMRDDVSYCTCLYPAFKEGNRLVLGGYCVVTQIYDCEVGEACVYNYWLPNLEQQLYQDGPSNSNLMLFDGDGVIIYHDGAGGGYPLHIYRRIE